MFSTRIKKALLIVALVAPLSPAFAQGSIQPAQTAPAVQSTMNLSTVPLAGSIVRGAIWGQPKRQEDKVAPVVISTIFASVLAFIFVSALRK